ncbi:MAG: hypothetical protein ACP5T2_05420 [Thermoprotei archaeon]
MPSKPKKTKKKNKKLDTSPPEIGGWGSFEPVQLVSPAARKMILSFLVKNDSKTSLSHELMLPRSTLYLYLAPAGAAPKDPVMNKILQYAISRYPLEIKSILRDSASYLEYYVNGLD